VEEALARASGYLRSQLASHLNLKRVPNLRFIYVGTAPRQGEAPSGTEAWDPDADPDAPLPDESSDDEGGDP
jgi:hypothetical protein